MTRTVELAVTIAVCSEVVGVLGCDMLIASLGTLVGESGPAELGRIELMEDNDIDSEVVGKIKSPVRLEELLIVEGATASPADGDDWSALLGEGLDKLE